MADEIKVVITGKDGVSKVFQEVSKSADSMQKAITKDAAAAGTSLNKMSQDAQKASTSSARSLDEMAQAADRADRAFAVAGAAIGASLTLFSRSITENQQNVANLTRTYGDAAGQLQAFAQQIQASTTFSSESAIESANIFGTLARNYGLSVDQIQQLIKVSTDLAATSGLTLEDTSQRVASAIRGEGEAAEALGLTMNQQAIDRNNLTLTMSNQEAAQFRLNALMEQTAFAEGAAGDKAATTAGQIAQLNNKFQDMARGALEAAGPLPEIVSGITSIGASSGLAITGIASLAKGMRDASIAAGGLRPLLAGLSSSGLGTGVALGGLAVAAGLAFVGTRELSRAFDGNFYQSLNKGNQVAADLNETISQLTGTLNNAALALKFSNVGGGLDQVGADMNRIKELQMEIAAGPQNTGFTNDEIVAGAEAFQALQTELDALIAKYGDTEQAAANWAAAQEDLGNVLIHASAGSDLARARALELSQAFANGEISLADYAWQLNWITENYAVYDQRALESAVTQGELNAKWDEGTVKLGTYTDAVFDAADVHNKATTAASAAADQFAALWLIVHEGEIGSRRAASGLNEVAGAAGVAAGSTGRMIPIIDGLGEAATRSAGDVHSLFAEIEHLTKFAEIDLGLGKTVTRSFDAARPAVSGFNDALKAATGSGVDFGVMLEGQREKALDFADQVRDAAEAVGLLDSSAEKLSATGIQSPTLDLSVNTAGATDAVTNVFRTIVSQTNAIGSQAQGVADWIGGLTVATDGYISSLQELYVQDQISGKTYRDAQKATGSILKDNADIQQDLMRIQAKQAPLIADLVHQEAAYIDTLADADAQTQLVALGYMDATESAKAFELAQLATNAAMSGFTGPATEVITAAAQADPVLKAMLADMGLITEHPDGTFTVNIDGAETVQSAIGDLSTAIDNLTTAINILVGEDGAATTQKAIEKVTGAANDVPTGISVHLDAVDNASGTIQAVGAALLALDGTHAQTTIDNYVNNVTTNTLRTLNVGPVARNGGVMGYANGGMVTASLAEVGMELARFSNGGEALIPNPGLYSIPVGTNILPAPATKAELSRRGGGGDIYINTIQIIAQNGDLEGMLRSEALRLARQR